MYLPIHHREDRLGLQHDLIRAYPLGMLVIMGRAGLAANPVPFVLDAGASQNGVLKAHIARANSLWQDYDPAHEALVIFQGPQIYVSPNYYASKKETGKIVPTWNYVCVQAYGTLKVMDDRDWLLDQLGTLTRRHEADQPVPWSIADAPEDYIAMMLKGIIGFEIDIARIEGKWKLSQNRSAADQASLVEALRHSAGENASAIASLMAKDSGKS